MLIGYLLGFSSAFLLSALIGGLWVLCIRDEDLPTLDDKELMLENKDINPPGESNCK